MALKKLNEFPANSIVKIDGRWGILCINFGYNLKLSGSRIVDFWDGGREVVPGNILVEGLPDDD